MEKKIRTELYKMSILMLGLLGLGIYAHEFVIAGIMAKAALNLTIFAVFGVAAGIAFSHVLTLKNEVLALKALQVDYGARSLRPLDPYKVKAVVFHEPQLLGHGYRMIAEELGKQDSLQISNATAQQLLHDIDLRISDRKSTTMYFSGLMVFLGLLGAFMGLMKTVHSVGELISAMDLSGAGGTDSIAKMIEGMKAPLNGMSVGFSSSLFGLMTSLVLGALERCSTSAMKTLRNEFEHWLSNVSALEAPTNEASGKGSGDLSGVARALEMGARQLVDIREVSNRNSRSVEHTQQALARMMEAIVELSHSVEKMNDPRAILQPVTECVAELARNQTSMVQQFDNLFAAAEEDRASIREAIQVLAKREAVDMDRVLAKLESISVRQASLADEVARAGTPANVAIASEAAPAVGKGLLARLRGLLTMRTLIVAERNSRREIRKLRADIRRMMLEHRRFSRRLSDTVGAAVADVEAGRAIDNKAFNRMLVHNEHASARLAVLMDRLQLLDEPMTENPADREMIAGLHGARLEMDILHRRLNAIQEQTHEGSDGQAATPRAAQA